MMTDKDNKSRAEYEALPPDEKTRKPFFRLAPGLSGAESNLRRHQTKCVNGEVYRFLQGLIGCTLEYTRPGSVAPWIWVLPFQSPDHFGTRSPWICAQPRATR